MDAWQQWALRTSQESMSRILELVQCAIDENPELGELPVDIAVADRLVDEFVQQLDA